MLIQRIGSTTQKDAEFLDSFIAKMVENKGSCDEIWFSSEYGFPPMQVHRDMADNLVEMKKRFEDAGIRVSLQISNTVGHGQYMQSKNNSGLVYDGSPAEHMVGPDGTEARYCFCWNGRNFRNYMVEQMQVYAKVKPRVLWLDDDLRAENHNPVSFGCFCDACIKSFNEKYGASFTREELVHEINYGDVDWRARWIEFERASIYDFVYEITKAFNVLSPDTIMGYEYGYYGCYTGQDYNYVYDAMLKATGKAPHTRPGGGVYNDRDPHAFTSKMMLLTWSDHVLPDYVVDSLPEVENLPDVTYGKSIAGCTFESTLYFASGSTGMTYAMAQNKNEPMEWHGEMLKSFAKQRPYWEKLAEVNRKTRPAGLEVYVPADSWKREMTPDEPIFNWTFEPIHSGSEWMGMFENAQTYEVIHAGTEFMDLGFPVCYGDGNNPRLLPFSCARCLSKEEIEELLSQPVITDGETLTYLTEKGYGFSAKSTQCLTQKMREHYEDHPINGGETNGWGQGFYFSYGSRLTDITGETEVVSSYSSGAKDQETVEGPYPYGIANAVVKTEKGAKWMVYGYAVWTSVVSSAKRNQIVRAVDYISDKKLAAYVENPLRSLVFARENKEGTISAVSVVNETIGESGPLTVRIRKPAGAKFTFISQSMGETPLEAQITGDECIVTIPSLAPWSVGTIFID